MKSLISYSLLLAGLPLILFSTSLNASEQSYNVIGWLFDEAGSALIEKPVMLYDEDNVRIAVDTTNTVGGFTLTYKTSSTSAKPDGSSDHPVEFLLGSSYPNPFNPRTTIPFKAPVETRASITLYNILGQQVMHTQAEIAKGINHIELNLGGRVAQGQYLLRVQGDGFSETQTMTFLSAGISSGTPGIRVRSGDTRSMLNQKKKEGRGGLSEGSLRIVINETLFYQSFEHVVPSGKNHNTGNLTVPFLNEIIVSDYDGNDYPTVRIGDQIWMTLNLRTRHYRNGDPIAHVPDTTEWGLLRNTREGAWVYYRNDASFVDPRGKLYNFYAVMDERGVCPEGFTVPSDEEWMILEKYLGMSIFDLTSTGAFNFRGGSEEVNAGGKLKTTGTDYWNCLHEGNLGATNETGFSSVPGGYRLLSGRLMTGHNDFSYLWTSTPNRDDDDEAWVRAKFASERGISRYASNNNFAFSIRCVKETPKRLYYIEGDGVSDIDGNDYETVIIGEREWMAENLRTTRYADGGRILNVTDAGEWADITSAVDGGAWAHYDNSESYGEIYGKLYNWYAANNPSGLCPEGWSVPTNDEWKELERFLGMEESDSDATGWRGEPYGGMLKSEGTEFWESPNRAATNQAGFSGLPGGYRNFTGEFESLNTHAGWWTRSRNSATTAWRRELSNNNSTIYNFFTRLQNGYSVRCVRDNTD